MPKYFRGTYTTTRVLSNPTTDNPATVTSTGLISVNSASAYAAGIFGDGFAWTLTNLGTVESIGNQGFGIDLQAGGSVTNGQSGSTAGLIAGSRTGLAISGGAGTLANFGTVVSYGTAVGSAAVDFRSGGSVTNGASGSTDGVITGVFQAIGITGSAGTVTNFGTISATGTYGTGIYLGAGGSVTNGSIGVAGASITGGARGVAIYFSAGTVSNLGTITGIGTNGSGVKLSLGGSVDNASGALISGYSTGVYIRGSTGTVSNLGTIAAGTGPASRGVRLSFGGSVDNARGALISGGAIGVEITGSAGTVSNLGTIQSTGTFGQAIRLSVGGTVTNAAGGVLLGAFRTLVIYNNPGTVTNSGTISGTGTSGVGVWLQAGGSVANATAGALITGVFDGVFISGSAGTVSNLGTIAGTGTYGIGLRLFAGGTVTNGASGSPGGLIQGFLRGVQIDSTPGTVANYGTIEGTGAASTGVNLQAGGSVGNAATIALITGYANGVSIGGSAGTVSNFGTIEATGTLGVGVELVAGGSLTNGAGGVISAPGIGVGFFGAAPGTVVNLGQISGTGPSSYPTGVLLQGGGSVTNGQADGTAASITGLQYGVWTRDAAASISNYGTIAATGTGGTGVFLQNGGRVENSGSGASISGLDEGIRIAGALVGTVDNSGTITGGLKAIYLGAGGYVTNQLGGVLQGSDGVRILGPGAIAVVNLGSIAGSGYAGVYTQGGTVTNGAAAITGASISGGNHGVLIGYAAGTVTNFATITATGAGVAVWAGGSVTNALTGRINGSGAGVGVSGSAGTVANFGTVSAIGTGYPSGIYLGAGGSVTNGAATVTTALIEGSAFGVSIGGTAGTVTNFGTITATGTGYTTGVYMDGTASVVTNYGTIGATGGTNGVAINLAQGGTVINAAGALLAGSAEGVRADSTLGTKGTVTNSGTITGYTDGVVLKMAGSTLANSGRITATSQYGFGVYLTAGGYVTNASTGLIEGYKGVLATYGAATVSNLGMITGSGSNGVGVELAFSGSVLTNGGTISGGGGAAVRFAGGNNRLTADPGAVFLGLVEGGDGVGDLLELAAGAATGTIGGVGSSFTGFESVDVDSAAVWLLTGSNTLGAGTTLSNAGTIDIGAALSLGGSVVNDGVIDIDAGGRLTLANGADGAGSITFDEPGGTLQIDGTTMPLNPIGGFASGDAIDLRGLAFTLQASYSFDGSTLSVTSGGVTEVLTLTGLGAGTPFTLGADGAGGTLIEIEDAGPNLLINGGFEASTDPVTTPPGWTNIGHSEGVIAYSDFTTQPVYEGLEFYDLGGFGAPMPAVGDGIAQTVATTPGTSYTLTFGLSGENAQDTETLRVAIGSQLTDFTLVSTGSGTFSRPFATQTIEYVATGTSTTIAFTILSANPSTGSNDPLIDGVAFKAVAGGPPPPANLALDPASDSGVQGDNITNVIAPVITGTGNAGDTVTLSDEGGVLGTGTVALDGTWSITTSTLAEGSHTLTATATDSGGGVSAASDPLLLTIDTTAPVVTAELAHDTGTPGDRITSDPMVSGTGSPNATITISVDGAPPISVVADAGGVWSFTPTLADGVHTLTASETDAAGNTGSALPVTFTLDTTAPPAPSGLTLLSPQSDSGVLGDNLTNVTRPIITGTGEAGATVMLFDGGVFTGQSTIVAPSGGWILSPLLGPGVHVLTATEIDDAGNLSAPSAGLTLTIDTSAPQTAPVSASFAFDGGPRPIGIAAPDGVDNPSGSLVIKVASLPGNGTITLADGVTLVTVGQALTIEQLKGLLFAPAPDHLGESDSFSYTVTDLAGNAATGEATLTVTGSATVSFLDFVFIYNDGRDYYYGRAADDGTFGYHVGLQIPTSAGNYTIFHKEGPPATAPAGSVFIDNYWHGGPGAATTTPDKISASQADGTDGLGSESGAIRGVDGQLHAFSSASAASFATNALFGFVFSYADGAAFYTGTVAVVLGSTPAIPPSGGILGSYSLFDAGVTGRAAHTVVIDRFTAGGASYIPDGAGAVAGFGGLGSEASSITVGGTHFSFSDQEEPVIPAVIPAVLDHPTPDPSDVFTGIVTEIYLEVLGRAPDPGGLATYTAGLAAGQSAALVRRDIAGSDEATGLVQGLYHQVFGRDADPGGLAAYISALANGSSLVAVRLILGQSAEAQDHIGQLYQEVLGRPADGVGLTAYMAGLANGASLAGVRGIVAHSFEAASDLVALFQDILGRPPGAAELVGMEDLLAGSATQPSLSDVLSTAGSAGISSAGGFTTITDDPGDDTLTAPPQTPTLFVFSEFSLGHDAIAGFDPERDTIQLPQTLVADLATLNSRTTALGADTLIALTPSQSIQLTNLAPATLTPANFLFL